MLELDEIFHGKREHRFRHVDYADTDFNPTLYTKDELEAIRNKISEELDYIRKKEWDIKFLETKLKYEGKWIEDHEDLYYISKFVAPYDYEYYYFTKNHYSDQERFCFGISNCRFFDDFEMKFSRNFRVLDAKEGEELLCNYVNEYTKFTMEVLCGE